MKLQSPTARFLAAAVCSVIAVVMVALPAVRAADAPTDAPKTDASKKDQSPVEMVDNLSKQVIGLLGNKQLSVAERRRKIQDTAYANIDFPTLSRLTLGAEWKKLNEAQQKDFMKEYRTHLANTYRSMIDNYTDEQVKMVGDRDEGQHQHTVLTKVIDPKNGDESKVDYRVRNLPQGGWRIIDITIEGISLAANFKSQFVEVIHNNGGVENGGFDRLMKMLREKNAAAEKDQGPATQPTRQPAEPTPAVH